MAIEAGMKAFEFLRNTVLTVVALGAVAWILWCVPFVAILAIAGMLVLAWAFCFTVFIYPVFQMSSYKEEHFPITYRTFEFLSGIIEKFQGAFNKAPKI